MIPAILTAVVFSYKPYLENQKRVTPQCSFQEFKTESVDVIEVEATGYTWTGNKTFTGTWPQYGTIAVDPEVIPLGSTMYVENYGFGTAEDTGRLIKQNKIDLYFPSRKQALDWGRRKVKVILLQKEGDKITKLRLLRLLKDLTIIEASSRTNISTSDMSRIERGILAVTPAQREVLARFYGVDAGEIFEENGLAKILKEP